MQRISMWCLPGLLAMSSAVWPQSNPATEGTEKAVAALEQKWLQADKTNNPDLLAPLLAENFVGTSRDGKVTSKADILADTKTIRWESAGYDAMKVTIFGSTAITTGIFKGKGTNAKGKHMDETVRWTDTWVKMPDGLWQCVASHVSPVKI
jgi:ketosteroid isomerase-like protein